jgi:hypothetical protein
MSAEGLLGRGGKSLHGLAGGVKLQKQGAGMFTESGLHQRGLGNCSARKLV